MTLYVYPRLRPEEIRVVTLLPGKQEDPIRLAFSHHRLPETEHDHRRARPVQQVQETLPRNWKAHETLDEQILFENLETGQTSWKHPDSTIVPDVYAVCQPLIGFSVPPVYEALSYTWGEMQDLQTVHVVTQPHQDYVGSSQTDITYIGEDLAEALRFLRRSDDSRTLWIDALCINQQDAVERSEQMELMPTIYKQATVVIAWLGPPSISSDIGLSKLQYLGEQVEITRQSSRLPSPQCKEPDLCRSSFMLQYDSQTWHAIHDITKRAYFERLWIWQELQLARRAVMQCGQYIIAWDVFRRAIICLFEKDYIPSLELRESLRRLRPLTRLRDSDSLNVLFSAISRRKCSEPRDRVYGLLGLASSDFRMRVIPHYSLPVSDVYKNAFLAQVDLVNRLELIQDYDLGYRKIQGPSWVPDWSVFQKNNSFAGLGLFASGVSCSDAKYLPPDTLQVHGVQCSTVASVGKTATEDINDALHVIREWEPNDLDSDLYITGESMADAYVSTLCLSQHSGRNSLRTQRCLDLHELKRSFFGQISTRTSAKNTAASTNNYDTFWALDRTRGKKFFTTQDGHIGIGPSATEPGNYKVQPEVQIV